MEQRVHRCTGAVLLLLLLAGPAAAMLNPAAVYCEALGHRYVTESTPGGEYGYCILSGGTRADAWEFFSGTTGEKYGACAKAGYRQESLSDPALCPFSARCAVCIGPGGTRVPAAVLLNLSYAESSCGDGTCGGGEHAVSCPADCNTGEWDHICDGEKDGRCDPECPEGEGDPDCGGIAPALLAGAGLAVLVITGAGLYFLLRNRH